MLLHGQPGSPADWQLVSGRLPAPLHAVAADRPGYGSSRLPAGGFAAKARAVLDDLDSRGITRAVLVGHSYGGGVAACLAHFALGAAMPEDLAVTSYTSETTGLPEGTVLANGNSLSRLVAASMRL